MVVVVVVAGDGTVSFAEFIDALWRHKLDALKLKLAGAATYGRTTASSAPRRGTAAGAGQHGGEEEGEEASVVDWVALFRRYDRNSDGNLSFDEFRLAVRKDARIPPAQMDDSELREVFDHVDRCARASAQRLLSPVGLKYPCVRHRWVTEPGVLHFDAAARATARLTSRSSWG